MKSREICHLSIISYLSKLSTMKFSTTITPRPLAVLHLVYLSYKWSLCIIPTNLFQVYSSQLEYISCDS